MKTAILLTSNDTSEFALRFPNDGEKFRYLLKPHRPSWTFDIFNVTNGEYPDTIHDYQGFIITGSPASVNDMECWIKRLLDLVQELNHTHKPTIGCCFGHQIIARAFGGVVGENNCGWSIGVVNTNYKSPQNWMHDQKQSIKLYSAHHEQITRIPDIATVIGTSETCQYASCLIGNHILTTQYHPEMSADFMNQLVYEMADELGYDGVNQALRNLNQEEEGSEFGMWMVRFLEQAAQSK